MAIEPIYGMYVHDEETDTDGIAKFSSEELEDIRVGADGIAYANAGDAVRGQVEELHEIFDEIGVATGMEEVLSATTYGKHIESNGTITDGAGNYGVNVVSVTPGKTYYISASMNFNKPLFAWYDENMDVVQLGQNSQAGSAVTNITDAENVCPQGAAYIGISSITSGTSANLKVKIYTNELENKFDVLLDNLGGYVDKVEIVQLDNTYGYYLNSQGVITSTSGNYAIRKGEVTAGNKYYITASANWSAPYYAWYDENENVVSVGTMAAAGSAYSSITDELATAPEGAVSIAIGWNTASVTANLKLDKGEQLAGKWYGKKWACVGDSLTALNQYTSKHYFDYISDKTDIEVINMGDSGTGYAKAADSNRAFYQRILNIDSDADVVTIFGSFNDLSAGLNLGTYTDTGTTTIAGCINKTIDNLQTVIPTVILGIVAPTPWQSTQPTPNSAGDNYVNLLQAICEHRTIPFLDLYRDSNLRPWDSDFRALAYSKDNGNGTHPDETGHKIIAPKFKAFLETLLV